MLLSPSNVPFRWLATVGFWFKSTAETQMVVIRFETINDRPSENLSLFNLEHFNLELFKLIVDYDAFHLNGAHQKKRKL